MTSRQWNPGDLLEISGFYWKTAVLHAAVKLDLFSAIGDGQLAGTEISRQLNAPQRGVERLLDALAAMELLVKVDGIYANTPSGQNFLSKNSAQYIGHIIMHHHHLVESWSKLDQAVQSGMPVRSRSSFSKEEWRESFLLGMFNMAMGLAPKLVPQIDLSTRKHLLDLGGGPGTYAIHFCLNNPGLRAEVYDLPTTRPFAEKIIKQFNLADRINFIDGNYLTDPVEGRYDVAWLSHILHGEGPEECRMIIQKAVDALDPQGSIIIHEFILNNNMDGPLFPALFSLNMLLGTDSGQSYSEQQLTDMLLAAGVKNIRRIPLNSPNDSGLLVADK
ncbi:O-methyltransferase [Olavius sp. associated proteobacterium Delta 1]|nr:O-methyltransferase [Olavius sp. associated proteobacterium Delta 1]